MTTYASQGFTAARNSSRQSAYEKFNIPPALYKKFDALPNDIWTDMYLNLNNALVEKQPDYLKQAKQVLKDFKL